MWLLSSPEQVPGHVCRLQYSALFCHIHIPIVSSKWDTMYITCLWESNVSNRQTFILKQKWRGYSRYRHPSMNFRWQFLNTHLLYINIKSSLSNRILFICARMSILSHIYVWQLFGNSKVQPSVIVITFKKGIKHIYSMRKEILKYQFPILNLISIWKY